MDTDRVDSGGDEFILVNAIVEQGGRPLYGSLSGVIMYASMYISKATRFKTADAAEREGNRYPRGAYKWLVGKVNQDGGYNLV